jgi:uncharacterized protein with GYD domain
MPRYLFMANYTSEGAKGLLEAGGKSRQDVVAKTAESVGGRLESFDFAFGHTDAYIIVDLPDHAAAAKVALSVSAAGGAHVVTVVLIPAEDLPSGSGGDVAYTPPGA